YKANINPNSFVADQDSINLKVMFAVLPEASKQLSIFWCGFSKDFCGQSDADDVYPTATIVIMAFANSKSDGSLDVDVMPTDLIKKWQNDGKKVLISIGGQNGHWDSLFEHPDTFVESLTKIINDNNLDGADLDIEGYSTPPAVVADTIHKLRQALGSDKLIVVSPENVTVYPSPTIPVPSTGGTVWNYFVPILNEALDDINYVQPQMYNNNYISAKPATAEFIEENYLGWMNKLEYKIPGFSGVPENKLIIGLLASPSAGISTYYAEPTEVKKAVQVLESNYNINVGGIMFWDSNWDKLNNYAIGKASSEALGLE
ncbi:hypothetical protein IB644_06675, partial [Allofrancisella guangzhouensis]